VIVPNQTFHITSLPPTLSRLELRFFPKCWNFASFPRGGAYDSDKTLYQISLIGTHFMVADWSSRLGAWRWPRCGASGKPRNAAGGPIRHHEMGPYQRDLVLVGRIEKPF
jgi:hypothetical protein